MCAKTYRLHQISFPSIQKVNFLNEKICPLNGGDVGYP